ncbi:MAG: demethoxyubiquinone hydroxylase family protein [Sphingomonadaceae bacterium]|uniref:demethoxyubiquinone hydroxylase family protein n=1 Tax=Thermaurantiacus sp. TaxID=2820283 RepID=UPI00298EE900|nr:demethoxyubiquinone hydroxylase family protein [Thermaurantiacus sp.]MCS6987050.1 demethoxyubiquinone hydroxylase family protein [Sphingomonadaceae bacterium]MDW8415612.1 demethoxyubiquinone hydroxylase family protein [Thermaurantiacus sp.]
MTEDVERMIRVDHAGEYGATRIYAGQLAVMGDRAPVSPDIRRMARQEEAHLAHFEALLLRRGVRPTLLQPLWHVAGYALGVASALVGPKMAMAVTAAVETEIDRHYQRQRERVAGQDPELEALIAQCQSDEVAHRDEAFARGARDAPAYPVVAALIRAGCRLAIRLSERL